MTTYFSWLFPGAYNKFTEDEKQYLKPSIVCISNASPRVFNLMTMKRYVDMMKQGMIKYLRQWTKGDWVAIHVGSGGAYGGSYSNFSGYLLG